MTTEELFNLITSAPKWYGGTMSCQAASRILRKHKAGTYTGYKELFKRFGYTEENQTTWKKESSL